MQIARILKSAYNEHAKEIKEMASVAIPAVVSLGCRMLQINFSRDVYFPVKFLALECITLGLCCYAYESFRKNEEINSLKTKIGFWKEFQKEGQAEMDRLAEEISNLKEMILFVKNRSR